MCKFHKDVAKDIATDPVTGDFNAGRFCVALLAMAHFRIEQKEWAMPEMYECDGFNPEELATPQAVAAFARSGLATAEAEIKAYRDDHIGLLHAAMDKAAEGHDLDLAGLGVPDMITKDGYRHCASMPADPRKNGPFMDRAVVDLFAGYDDPRTREYATGDLRLISADDLPADMAAYEPIRAACERFISQPGIMDALRVMFRHSVARLFQSAESDLSQGKGLRGESNCIMCKGKDGLTQDVAPSETVAAQSLSASPDASSPSRFWNGLRTVRDGIGGALVSHAGCFVIPAVAATFGASLSHTFMAATMYVTSPLIAVGAAAGLDRLQGRRISQARLAVAGVIALGVAFAINAAGGHDHGDHDEPHHPEHHHHHHEHHHHHSHEGKIWRIDGDNHLQV